MEKQLYGLVSCWFDDHNCEQSEVEVYSYDKEKLKKHWLDNHTESKFFPITPLLSKEEDIECAREYFKDFFVIEEIEVI